MGDFNCFLKGDERSYGCGVLEGFANWMMQKGLINLGFSGHKFTWSYGRSMDYKRVARLDRGLCDTEWRQRFPMASVKHLTHSYSDHCPLLLQLNPGLGERLGPRPFRFLAMLLSHKEFSRWFSEQWSCEEDLTKSLNDIKMKLQEWNKNTFGNVFKKKRRNALRLEGVQKALESKVRSYVELESKVERGKARAATLGGAIMATKIKK